MGFKKHIKKKWWIYLVIISVFILLAVLISKFGLLQSINPEESTLYNSYGNTKNTITYSQVDASDLRNAFNDYHYLNENQRRDFSAQHINKQLFTFVLNLNNIDSSKFSVYSGRCQDAVFTPNEIYPVDDESCIGGPAQGPYISELQALGYKWTGIDGCPNAACSWSGGLSSGKFSDIAKRLECEVSGTVTQLCGSNYIKPDRCEAVSISYSQIGDVTWINNVGFVCKVSKKELLDTLPKVFHTANEPDVDKTTGGVGWSGKVEFYLKEDSVEGTTDIAEDDQVQDYEEIPDSEEISYDDTNDGDIDSSYEPDSDSSDKDSDSGKSDYSDDEDSYKSEDGTYESIVGILIFLVVIVIIGMIIYGVYRRYKKSRRYSKKRRYIR